MGENIGHIFFNVDVLRLAYFKLNLQTKPNGDMVSGSGKGLCALTNQSRLGIWQGVLKET